MHIAGTLTQKGQITIPASIRHLLGLKPFDKLIFTVHQEKIVAAPIKQTFFDLAGSLKHKHKGGKPFDFKKARKQFMKEMAEKTMQAIT